MRQYLTLENLKNHKLARKLGDIAWKIFNIFDFEGKSCLDTN